MSQMNISIEGERGLRLAFDRHLEASTRATRKALQTAGLKIVADAKENLRENGSVVTGMLRASGKVQKVEGNPDEIDAGFFAKDSTNGYAAAVEYGRRAGKMPPVDMLFAWLKKRNSTRKAKSALQSALVYVNATGKKPKTTDDLLRSAAWALARHIAAKGTRPHPFFAPAVKKNEKAFEEVIAQAMAQEVNNGKQ